MYLGKAAHLQQLDYLLTSVEKKSPAPKTDALDSMADLMQSMSFFMDTEQTDVCYPDLMQLFVWCKNERRRKKGSPHFINAVVLQNISELESFLKRLSISGKLTRVDVLFQSAEHWFYLSVNKEPHQVTFFIFDQFASDTYTGELLETIAQFYPRARIFSYASSIGPLKTSIQSSLDCFWHAMQACFRMSKVDIFTVLERFSRTPVHSDDSALAKQYITGFAGRLTCKENIRLIFPHNVPPEMAALFISAERSGPFEVLPQATHRQIISSKSQNLQAVTNRRHEAGQRAMGFEEVSQSWPNDCYGQGVRYYNSSITYFKWQQIKMLRDWLLKPEQFELKIQRIVQGRLDFDPVLLLPRHECWQRLAI